MSGTPSSAVTIAAAFGALPSTAVPKPWRFRPSSVAGGDDPPRDPAAARALDGTPPCLSPPARGLVEIVLPVEAPLRAADTMSDWSDTMDDAARLLKLGSPGVDLVYGGADDAIHLPADDAVFVNANDVIIPVDGFDDPLVDIGSLTAAPVAFPPAMLDAPMHVGIAVEAAARVGPDAPDPRAPELSWLAAANDGGLPVGDAWAWNDARAFPDRLRSGKRPEPLVWRADSHARMIPSERDLL